MDPSRLSKLISVVAEALERPGDAREAWLLALSLGVAFLVLFNGRYHMALSAVSSFLGFGFAVGFNHLLNKSVRRFKNIQAFLSGLKLDFPSVWVVDNKGIFLCSVHCNSMILGHVEQAEDICHLSFIRIAWSFLSRYIAFFIHEYFTSIGGHEHWYLCFSVIASEFLVGNGTWDGRSGVHHVNIFQIECLVLLV